VDVDGVVPAARTLHTSHPHHATDVSTLAQVNLANA
jgi:hypothetical protein